MKTSGRLVLMAASALFVAQAAVVFGAPAKVCDARKYGAKADGTTKDTAAIQAAMDDCAKARAGAR
jgi:polygalacturonase